MESETELAPIITSAHGSLDPLHVVVVGAGGTGGRLIPPLMQMLRRGDVVSIVDGDIVEDRNLARQNFRTRDIGRNKAEVMAERYRRDGVAINAFASYLTHNTMNEISAEAISTIILGCVDNPKARNVMNMWYCATQRRLWIDGGNERRGGQVILSAFRWPFHVKAARRSPAESGSAPSPRVQSACADRQPTPAYQSRVAPVASVPMYEATGGYSLTGMAAMPQLLRRRPWCCEQCQVENAAEVKLCTTCQQPEASCRNRIDLQTVAVNQLSASCMLNILSSILYTVPMMTCGVFFSTMNTMSPIRLKEVRWESSTIIPEVTYAGMDTENI